MRPLDDLTVGANQILRRQRRRTVAAGRAGDVVDPFQHGHPAHAGHAEDVVIQPRERAVVVAEHAVPRDAGIEDADAVRRPVRLQAPGEHRGPCAIGVRRRLIAVRDGVAECHRTRSPAAPDTSIPASQ